MKGGLLYVLVTVCQSFRLLCEGNTPYTTRQFKSTWDTKNTQTFLSPAKTRSICMCLNVAVTPALRPPDADQGLCRELNRWRCARIHLITDSSFCEYFWWKWLDCHVNALFWGGCTFLPLFYSIVLLDDAEHPSFSQNKSAILWKRRIFLPSLWMWEWQPVRNSDRLQPPPAAPHSLHKCSSFISQYFVVITGQ